MRKTTTLGWAAAVFLVSAYLSLMNLGQVPLWHDEATSAFMGENLLRGNGFSAWNGRTLYVGKNGTAANRDLILASFPPLPAIPSALGMAVFGVNEFGVRVFHTLLGLASLILFWKLLRLDFAAQPRLRVLAFTLFALGTQTLLFFRYGRYVADAFFFTFLTLYAYRLYIAPGGKWWHLALAAVATLLNFLNQFAIGASFACALAVWHCMYHARSTTPRQWLAFAVAGGATAALCLAYLVAMGIVFSDDVLEFSAVEYELPWLQRKAVLVYYHFRDLLGYDILPLWVAVWLVWFALTQKRRPQEITTPLLRTLALLMLFLLFAAVFSVQPATEPLTPTRYIAPALAFAAILTAAFIDHLWQQKRGGRIAAIAVLLIALNTNLLAAPFIAPNIRTGETLQLQLPNLVREVHNAPRQDYIGEAVAYLQQNAQTGETIHSASLLDMPVLQFYLADQLIFCCALNDNAPMPKEKVRQLGVPIYFGDVKPDWIVIAEQEELQPADYERAYTSQTYAYPTHRPGLQSRTFAPLYAPPHLQIYRKVP